MSKINFSSMSPEAPLLILDMANNHNGSLEHGKRIIDEVASVEGLRFTYANSNSKSHLN